MRVCAICGAKWRGDPAVCPLDGGSLEDLPDPLLGRTIGGRYVITERVGAGGMGTVYRARHDVVGRDVAVKFLSPDLAADPVNRRRFLREAKAANSIDHEHIIDITDYGETDDGLVYLVMEFLDGESLARVIARGPMPPRRAVDISIQMSSALARAHELDVIHRDIKPDNVFLLPRTEGGDFVKLLDFGLAKMKNEMRLTASGAVFGTPEYMAPEQAKGAPLTGKADLYALGCVLHEMLTGDPPFSGTTPDLILKHIREAPQPPSARMSSIDRELDALVMRLLEKDPARRHTDAYHLLEDLRAIAERLPRPELSSTVREMDLGASIRAAQAVTQERISMGSAAELWDRRLARFRELAARAHPIAPPGWLTRGLEELERAINELARRRAELDRSATAARQYEEEARNARLQIGTAIDVLGRDESRTTREIEELTAKLAEARGRLEALHPSLLRAWAALGPAPDASVEPAGLATSVERLRDAGRLATSWIDAEQAASAADRELARRVRDREDVRFQIAQLKSRLAGLTAEVDIELGAVRERTRDLDEEVQELLDRIASRSTEIVKHLLAFPDLAEAVRAVQD